LHFVQGFRVPGFQGFRVSGFQGSRVSGFQGFRVPKTSQFWNFETLNRKPLQRDEIAEGKL